MLTSDHELPECVYEPNQPTMICPRSSTPNKTLYLSNLDDQKFLRFSIKYIYVFEKSVNTETLKESLSRVLVEYYPLAGRLRKCDLDDEDSKLEIECNGEGAVFAEAKMDLSVVEFLRHFATKPNKTSLRKLLYKVDAPGGFLDIPPLVIQVTNLSCGGMILCTAINHCFCDGIGTSQFLHAWAHACRSSGPATPPPFHDRHVLSPRAPPRVCFPHPVFTKSRTGPDIFEYLQSRPLAPASVLFSPAQIAHLKRQRAPSLKCTAFEVLASHTWRCWVKTLALTVAPPVPVKLIFSTSIRGKKSSSSSSPEIPAGYYGNAFVMACVEAGAEELAAAPDLSEAVRLVQRAKAAVAGEGYVQSMIDSMEEERGKMTDLSSTLVISQWSRLGLEEVEFGPGNKPVHMGPLCGDVYCLFLPVVGERDAVRVLVSLPESSVEEFEYYMTEFTGVVGRENNRDQAKSRITIPCEVDHNFKMVSV